MYSHNDDGTINEGGEGTLTKCECGREFFLSFREGFKCEVCRREDTKKFNVKLRSFLESDTFKQWVQESKKQRRDRIREYYKKKESKSD